MPPIRWADCWKKRTLSDYCWDMGSLLGVEITIRILTALLRRALVSTVFFQPAFILFIALRALEWKLGPLDGGFALGRVLSDVMEHRSSELSETGAVI